MTRKYNLLSLIQNYPWRLIQNIFLVQYCLRKSSYYFCTGSHYVTRKIQSSRQRLSAFSDYKQKLMYCLRERIFILMIKYLGCQINQNQILFFYDISNAPS